ncbi:MAG: hypothetical protein BJ554DRAFT_3166 [Olpidium bornovanus]|uniref:Uncharacterized protein n=1 Tax=Olpidium bornovanus TaxID=278681 RepID=A0A8H8DLF3_9FUNG|nr:MAG: hypothetical protein BJ554DRAFT_3166 [Olpidium bornovanus]
MLRKQHARAQERTPHGNNNLGAPCASSWLSGSAASSSNPRNPPSPRSAASAAARASCLVGRSSASLCGVCLVRRQKKGGRARPEPHGRKER